jgi:hypothetical protein
MELIKSVSDNQQEIIKNIINLHIPSKKIECDPTYSKGIFYKNGIIEEPLLKFDLNPQSDNVVKSDCRTLPIDDNSLNSLMFDPPFVCSSGPSLTQNTNNKSLIISKRFSSFNSEKELWEFYSESLKEFYRVLNKNGVLIFKCQDIVYHNTNFLSHIFITNEAVKIGFYPKDLFILTSKSRIISGKVKNQEHARKFHSYFLVFVKKQTKVDYFGCNICK